MRTITAGKGDVILLGRSGENGVTQVKFDISKWISEFGDGTAVLCHIRPSDSSPYVVSTDIDDGIVSWTVSSTDAAYSGIGKCELQYIVDEQIVKSKIWKTRIISSLDDAGDAPDPESGWVAGMIAKIEALVAVVPSITIVDADDDVTVTVTDAYGTTEATIIKPTVNVGTTETGEPGTDASVTNSGTNTNAVFDFVIPRGEQGNLLWPYFDIDADRGMLTLYLPDDYNGPSFVINEDGHLEVSYT